jgi:hypothetical protein
MAGLSEEMRNACRSTYDRFLEKHGVGRWPVRITLAEAEPLPNTSQRYLLEVECGLQGSSTSHKSLTSQPDSDLKQKLGRQLEIHYEYCQEMSGVRETRQADERATL